VAGKRSGRPKKRNDQRLNTTLALRLKDDLCEMLDAKLLELEKDHPEIPWNRGAVVRHMLYKAFANETAQEEEQTGDG